MHKTISKDNYETSIVSASFSFCAFLFKNFADKFIAITRLLIFNVIDIYLICLSVIKRSTDDHFHTDWWIWGSSSTF